MENIKVVDVRFEHHRPGGGLGIDEPRPRISWRFEGAAPNLKQDAYEIELTDVDPKSRQSHEPKRYKVESSQAYLVPWPKNQPLSSRQRYNVRVRAYLADHSEPTSWSEVAFVEAGLLDRQDWSSNKLLSAPWSDNQDKSLPEDLFRKQFEIKSQIKSARLYITSHGVYEAEINGTRVGDHFLAPGWTVYEQRLRYQTFDVTQLLSEGENCLGARVAEGWFKGRLGFEGGKRNIHGTRTALLARLEITTEDGNISTIASDETWTTTQGPIRMAEIYDGEKYDATGEIDGWSTAGTVSGNWHKVEALPSLPEDTALIAGSAEPTRRIEVIKPLSKTTTPTGKLVLDFRQNLVGYLRLRVSGPRGHKITLLHAEVLENGELGTRPLRYCEAKDTYTLRGEGEEVYEPRFTFHGFRYAQIDNWPESYDNILQRIEAIVCHTDMEETGDFHCSDDMLNQLWSNVRWSTKGNFLSIPTDCPQRDERLGWTGDIALFAPTATYLFGCHGILNDWLKGLYYEQKKRNGIPPMVSPNTIIDGLFAQVHPFAIWHDVTVLAPWALWEEHGDSEILEQQYESMVAWLDAVSMDKAAARDHLWDSNMSQLAVSVHLFCNDWTYADKYFQDWLDPSAPPDAPQKSATDMMLVANAFLIHSYDIMVRIAKILGKDDSSVYKAKATTARRQYAKEYISESGHLTSDSQTAYALAICFDLLAEPSQVKWAGDRLAEIVRANEYRVGTGFAGTPFVCEALAKTHHVDVAYGMLLNKKCPSWLYPVTMGATTIWERWDSMLPDGSINPGDMTSFNHYAYGSVAKFMVERVAGLKQLAPAWARCRVDPCVGGGVTSARTSHLTPHGRISVSWEVIGGDEVQINVVAPPFIEVEVVLGDSSSNVQVVGPGDWMFKRLQTHLDPAGPIVTKALASEPANDAGPVPEVDHGSAELQDQSQRLPFIRLILAYLCLCFCYLISYLDMNSVATSLPTIAEALSAGPTITWVGTSYLLGQLAFQPLYGRISDITGRKPVLLFSMGCIVIGGLLCGFARTPIWLYVCRTLSGIGGGGISSSVAIIVSDLVSLRSRGKYQGFISLAIGIGAASGPFVAAGLIHLTTNGWRWVFWVPSIMGALCFALLLVLLPLKPVSGSFKEKAEKIDWMGVMASIVGIVLTVIAIISGGSLWAWANVKTISILTIGIIMLLIFIIIEAFFARIPIIPLRLFKQRSPAVLILAGFFHDFAWQSTQYFVPLYYQTVRGFTPLKSATLILPFLLAQALASAASGPIMARYARYMPILRTGFIVWTIGAGLKILFNQQTHIAAYVVVLAVEGAGMGWVHQPGLVALQANAADQDRAVATGTRNVFRSLGGVLGVAIPTATYYAVLKKALRQSKDIPAWLSDRVLDGTWATGDPNTKGFEGAILDARMQGFRVIFIITVPLLTLCLLASFLVDDVILKGDKCKGDMREREQGSKPENKTVTPLKTQMDESRQSGKGGK
ncbi:alfa-L-rhamnosidase [Fusarium beomiforme]|uniref:alpha-L-rhamnosidase n=1 Tax=Fusarium beomiforme TaxID=44412 RepID=A0A9P5E049_9HYPO|nr:alfa-L-rhamnosidase [Fusarium beomiforme]